MEVLVFIIIALLSLSLGIFIYKEPEKIFKVQKNFYAMINWRIEPISVEREKRNTKLMGLFLICFVIISSLYYFLR